VLHGGYAVTHASWRAGGRSRRPRRLAFRDGSSAHGAWIGFLDVLSELVYTNSGVSIAPERSFPPRDHPGTITVTSDASGIDGVGGLRFEARSVPGQGRLIRIPFILRAFNANQAPDIVIPAPPDGPALPVGPKLITDAGTNVPAINSATVIATLSARFGEWPM
jgi:hypothetical protein